MCVVIVDLVSSIWVMWPGIVVIVVDVVWLLSTTTWVMWHALVDVVMWGVCGQCLTWAPWHCHRHCRRGPGIVVGGMTWVVWPSSSTTWRGGGCPQRPGVWLSTTSWCVASGGRRHRCGVTWQGHGPVVIVVVIVIDVAMVVEWWCRGRVRRASRAGRRSSVVVVELAWPKQAVTRAFDDDNGGDNGGNGWNCDQQCLFCIVDLCPPFSEISRCKTFPLNFEVEILCKLLLNIPPNISLILEA